MTHPIKSVLFSLNGLYPSKEEADFFAFTQPLGFILFDRNVKNPEQLRKLTDTLKDLTGRSDTPILIDQEGGRIQRLWPPYWEGLPFARTYGDWAQDESFEKALQGVRTHAQKLASMLLDMGINVDCWPCLDVAQKNIHPVLGKRLFGEDAQLVSKLGNVAVEEMLSHGLMPVVKHLPGYGRATVDPHVGLPVVQESLADLAVDFYPFQKLSKPVWGMTAHVLYQALDAQRPATLSPRVIDYIRHEIGFNGFLISDDISMGALNGDVAENSKLSIEAGCDAVLHCNGDLEEMKQVAKLVPALSDQALERLQQARRLL